MTSDAVRALRGEVRTARKSLARLTAALQAFEHRAEQLRTLQAIEQNAAARIAQLERLLDLDAVAAHVRAAVGRAELRRDPVPHVLVAELLPHDVYAAVVDAMPAAPFFDEDAGHGTALRVPPRLAPTHTIITTSFLNEVVKSALSAALLDRFNDSLIAFTQEHFPALPPFSSWDVEVTISQARIVRRSPGSSGDDPRSGDRRWDLLTGIVNVARRGDGEDGGSRLASTIVPFRGNTALVFNAPADVHAYEPILPGEPPGTARYTYEFGIGPTRDGRRRLEKILRGRLPIDPARSIS